MVTSRKSIFSGRALFISFLFLIIFLLLIARLLFIKFYQNEFLDNESNSRFISERPLMATRWSILDRNDKVLAFDVRSYTVGLDLSEFEPEEKVVEGLSRVLNLDKNSLKAKIDNKKGYIELLGDEKQYFDFTFLETKPKSKENKPFERIDKHESLQCQNFTNEIDMKLKGNNE